MASPATRTNCGSTSSKAARRQKIKGVFMAKSSRPTAQKRAREKARMERQKEKDARRTENRERKANAGSRPEGEDPDIAGIRPGPQPLPDEWAPLPTDVYGDEE